MEKLPKGAIKYYLLGIFMTWSRNVDSKQGTVCIFLMLDTSCHRPCFMSSARITSGLITAFPIPRREGQELLKFQEEILCYTDPTAQVSPSFETEKEAKTRPDHANPLAKESKAKVKRAVVKVTSPKATSPKFFRGKLPGNQRSWTESPKLLESLVSIWITSIIWWIINCHMDYNHLTDCSSPQG